jgi:hypothetical protein
LISLSNKIKKSIVSVGADKLKKGLDFSGLAYNNQQGSFELNWDPPKLGYFNYFEIRTIPPPKKKKKDYEIHLLNK